MGTSFERVAIVNRGEAAMRFISAVREFNHENGTALRTIALYTEPDRKAMFVREADHAVDLGPATFVCPRDGGRKSSYLDYERLERALAQERAEAVWPGWGFVSEDSAFVERLERLGIVFIGPGSVAMRALSNKVDAKRLAEDAHVPVVPWSGGPVETVDQARGAAERLGYPVMIKASAGGGGRGIRRVASPHALADAWTSARGEALKAFGDPAVYLERALEGVRHVEVQVIADHHGTIWAVGVRDCTIQRKHQKVLEECPAPTLTALEDRALREAAVRVCRAAGYTSAGTVEFLFDPRAHDFAFMEVNTRLQVEHTVTEVVTGLDLVKLQIHVARGGRLSGAPPAPVGHAIEVRLNAEDADNGFAAAPGTFVLFRLPTGPGLRIDRGVTEGDSVPPEFDSMVAKIIAHGKDRREALARLRRALAESAIVLEGGTTNRAFLLDLVSRPEVASAEVDTGWLERTFLAAAPARPHADAAFVQAAIEVYEAEHRLDRDRFYQTAARLRPETRREAGRTIELRHNGRSYRSRVYRLGPRDYRLDVDGRRIHAHVESLGRYERWLTLGEERHRVISVVQGAEHLVEIDGVPHRFSRDDLGVVRANAPAVVVALSVKAGDVVAEGQPLAVLEAMKMETAVVAPAAGRVRQVLVAANAQVGPGTALLQLDPESADGASRGERMVFPDVAGRGGATLRERALANLEEIRRLVLGFDVEPGDARKLALDYVGLAREWGGDGERHRAENEILGTFADVASLFRHQALPDNGDDLQSPSSGEYFLTYLRTADAEASALPASFLEKLQGALAHYGIEGLARTPALLDSLLWIWKSHQRVDAQVEAVLAILDRRLERAESLGQAEGEEFARLLDRLLVATEGPHPSLGDAVREARWRLFDRPRYEKGRLKVYAEAEAHLEALRRDPTAAGAADHIESLVACPHPLQGRLSARLEAETPAARERMIEVLVRRYYRIRDLEGFRTWSEGGRAFAGATYVLEGRLIQLLATHASKDELAEVLEALRPQVEAVPLGHDVVVDLYLWHPGPLGLPEANGATFRAALEAAAFGRPVRRVGLTLAGPGEGETAIQYFTLRCDEAGCREEPLYRGFHPMIGKRLRLWCLANFDLERLPSVEDVYLFRGVARENLKDERLFALAEVRDVTPVRDPSGRVVQIPHLERMFLEALAGVRRFQAKRKPGERLHWNRVLLDVWPPLPLSRDEINGVAHRLAPAAEGLGIESVWLRAELPDPRTGEILSSLLKVSTLGPSAIVVSVASSGNQPIRPLSEYGQRVTRLRQRGLHYPYEIVRLMTPTAGTHSDFPPGTFEEMDLDPEGRLVKVERSYGRNAANVVVGLMRNLTDRQPEGMTRVTILGDPSREVGSIAEPECRRIMAALDLAESLRVPLEWFTLSAGAKISMESGTENMDWISRVLRRLVTFTQSGGEVNVVVCGINVGAQPYWNAEATMLMHTRGILVMIPEGAMVLTGKTALDYSGSVSAEDNFGIGGYDRIMGPNGEAQYWARDISDACRILFQHYAHTYVVPGERFPRRARTTDPRHRDVRLSPHGGQDGAFASVGDVFSDETNPGRKKPFEIRRIMAAAVDQDHPPLERWAGWRDAETAVVWDAHLGGIPVCVLGFESQPLPRLGFVPTDGPEHWTSGTLFPRSSKKIARAINATSGNRPLVVLANLSGFDGSPESMRRLQLEYGAEIGRAVVNFKGPIVFCVVSRYHGGAFVVFSKTLHDNLEVSALEGTHASVIGGAPAAAVVFAREVDGRTKKDPRVAALEADLRAAPEADERRARARLSEAARAVRSEKLGQVADEFDRIHSVERALRVGSLDRILPAAELRPYLIDAVERGMAKEARRAD